MIPAIHRILAETDGSVTVILQALFEDVQIETELQKIIRAGPRVAQVLEINPGEEVNLRVVVLKSAKKNLCYAISLTPVKRIEPEFRAHILREDTPIGRIMKKLKIESRREIENYNIIKASPKLAKIFDIPPGSPVLRRSYFIIRKGKKMMKITEFFPIGGAFEEIYSQMKKLL